MIPPHEQGDLEVGEVALGSNYGRQVYFDLLGNDEIASNVISEWDLSLESASGGWTIRLNSSKFMLAGNSRDTDFSIPLEPADLEMVFDKSDGNPDSTAIGNWLEVADDSVRSLEDNFDGFLQIRHDHPVRNKKTGTRPRLLCLFLRIISFPEFHFRHGKISFRE